jgi:hypothetical protein
MYLLVGVIIYLKTSVAPQPEDEVGKGLSDDTASESTHQNHIPLVPHQGISTD